MHRDSKLSRRNLLALSASAVLASSANAWRLHAAPPATESLGQSGSQQPTYPFTLPKLDFAYEALEPHIDAQTMRIHHTKHHQGYIDKLNTALQDHPQLQQMTIEQLLRQFEQLPAAIKTAVRHHGGGHANHTFFWQILRPAGTAGAGGQPQGELAQALQTAYGSVAEFQKQFNEAGKSVFGSGWVFLVAEPNTRQLKLITTPNQDSVLMLDKGTALIGCDVWEHAYYLKYQNRREDYLKAFWNVLAWDQVADRYAGAKSGPGQF